MLQGVVGEPAFLQGVSTYLRSHVYGNATTIDLWKGMSDATGAVHHLLRSLIPLKVPQDWT